MQNSDRKPVPQVKLTVFDDKRNLFPMDASNGAYSDTLKDLLADYSQVLYTYFQTSSLVLFSTKFRITSSFPETTANLKKN